MKLGALLTATAILVSMVATSQSVSAAGLESHPNSTTRLQGYVSVAKVVEHGLKSNHIYRQEAIAQPVEELHATQLPWK